jgi:hypothetical protein
MIAVAIFLTSQSTWILVQCMRRVLRVRAAFEPTRSSDDQLVFAYEQVVPTVRRALGRRDNEAAALCADSTQRKIAP